MTAVKTLMTKTLYLTTPDTPLAETCRLMWEHDCGAIPVVEPNTRHLAGMVTDRDACMAAYTSGRSLRDVPTGVAMTPHVRTCRADDDVAGARATMEKFQVRRLPVTNAAGECVGILSLNDLARAAGSTGNTKSQVADTLAAICESRDAAEEEQAVVTTG